VTTSFGMVSGVDDTEGAGAPAAFEAFYRRHWLAMVRLAGLLVDDVASAEDVAQDAFVAFEGGRSRLRSTEAELAYLRTCVLNGARSVLRRRALSRRHQSPAAALDGPGADSVALAGPQDSELLATVPGLPRRQREVLVLRYWLDLSHAEVARVLGVTESTAKSTASRALDALECLMRSDDD
jgi:RNA polymerase sigma-70 factor (sigma-E family)